MDYQQQFEQWVPKEEQRQKDEYDTKAVKAIPADNVR
eukprot:CAMPEP_0116864402 /NCGR_PEP_ID=MMETSP0418-20121206/24799_1 /TAXON_ID=1158023 /ORGANISM="Astrosyne radiata, Strain 13vi08-1A" /LENGTH=36 /DNA_ID= /DNA_START= /DNA_END= /DNA_ORIENTATION=